ncbi:single-stranded DNA-binding protein [Spirosoma utsteinense]|uniref:Single-stranded DNA-binding protein n=1 Tax=Spirosoma utsteinense TaxID=2585773 RepID=A0ABR6W2S8_9BACT|nr:single-stranded DNA-binding protein [Spirosoma utsteinense]MBC3784291.1 single-strand DNA-binding protein [Spirosoma utsteinense]MBC3790911.1 single-strand DNA-binding protein [Spirosoma utsteinense]
MASLNKVILIGNVGYDPDVRYLDGGSVVAKFSVATNERYTTRTGEQVEQTEWFRVEVWNDQAKIIEKYVRKGQQIYVEGRLRTETYTDKEGKERFALNVRATTFQFLGGPNEREGAPQEAPRQQQAPQPAAPAPDRRPQAAPQPQAAPTTAARPPQQRREPDPVPFESNSGDDDLPF